MCMSRTDAARQLDRRPQFHALEDRRLLHAGHADGFNVSFNFQPNGTTPSGYVADTGKKFTQQGDLKFGWDKDNSRHVHNRRTEAITRLDTIAFMGIGDSATKWEVEVPNGLYRVKIVAGDARYTNSTYAFDAEDRTILNRKANKANKWRKGEGLVWVSDGRLTLTSGKGAVNNKIASLDIERLDPHVTGQDIKNPFSMNAIVQNEMAAEYAIPLLNELNAKTIRVLYDVDWDADVSKWDVKNLTKYKKAGFTTLVCFFTNEVPTYEQAKAFFQRIVDYPGFTDLVDFWQMGNEPNHERFWNGTASQFVNNYMKPAYEVIHPLGEAVVGGPPTWDANYAAQLQSLGYGNWCDYAAFHPYGYNAQQVIERATNAKAAFGGKPLIVTEWNIAGDTNNLDAWADQVALAAEGLRDITYLSMYYALGTGTSMVGQSGVYDFNTREKNGKFFDAIKGSMLD